MPIFILTTEIILDDPNSCDGCNLEQEDHDDGSTWCPIFCRDRIAKRNGFGVPYSVPVRPQICKDSCENVVDIVTD